MLKRLLREGKLDNISSDFKEAEKFFVSAEQDIDCAFKNKETSKNWSFVILYQAAIKIIKGLLISEGLRAKGESQHITFLQTGEELIGRNFKDLFEFLDKMRRKRHRFIYDADETITDVDLEKGFRETKHLLGLVKDYIRKKNPQRKLFKNG